jgi:hypothetical protein
MYIYPHSPSRVFPSRSFAEIAGYMSRAVIKSFVNPGSMYMPWLNNVLMSAIVWALYVIFFTRPAFFWAFWGSLTSFDFFFHAVYGGDMRHYGLLYMLTVALLWIIYEKTDFKNYRAISILVIALFCAAFGNSLAVVRYDMFRDFSSSRAFSDWIKQQSHLKDAIILSEPDYAAESLAYYLGNKVYLPRERRFGGSVNWSRSEKVYSLGKLLNTAKKIKYKYRKPVLILIQYPMILDELHHAFFLFYNRRFDYSEYSIKNLNRLTVKRKEFTDAVVKDENYTVYEVL